MISVKTLCIRYLDNLGIDTTKISSISDIRKFYDIGNRNIDIIISKSNPESLDAALNNFKLLTDYILNSNLNSLYKIENITSEEADRIIKSRIKMKNTLIKAIEIAEQSCGKLDSDEGNVREEILPLEEHIYELDKIQIKELKEKYKDLAEATKKILHDENVQRAMSKEDFINIATLLLDY